MHKTIVTLAIIFGYFLNINAQTKLIPEPIESKFSVEYLDFKKGIKVLADEGLELESNFLDKILVDHAIK